MKKLVIFGTGDFARVAYVYLTKDSPYQVSAFTVHSSHLTGAGFMGRDLVPFEGILNTHPPDDYAMFVAIGFRQLNKARATAYHQAKAKGYELISYVNTKAVRWGEINIGDNCFIFENNVIQPFVRIGNDVIIWSGNHIGHDAIIGDHCFISSHAVISGHVTIGPYCFVGVNATFRDGITVAPECVIGAGAVVLRNTRQGGVYAVKNTEPIALSSSELPDFS